MRFSRLFLSIVLLVTISPITIANTTQAPLYSPYADLTLDVKWNSEYQDLDPIDLANLGAQNQIKAFHLGFITDAGSCEAAWGGYTSYALNQQWAKRLTDAMAKQGMKTTISFGGASGNDLSMNCSTEQLLSIFEKTASTYQAKKLDFDVENGTANVPKLISTLKKFQDLHPAIELSLTLPVMPEGLAPREKDLVSQAVEAQLKFSVNLMAMDYGDAYPGDMGTYAKNAAIAVHDFLKSKYPHDSNEAIWQKISITPMIGLNDTPSEQFTLANASSLKAFAIENHLEGLGIWSINRDKPCTHGADKNHCSGNHSQQMDYEFSKILNA